MSEVSEAELVVMDVLWEESPLSAATVADRVPAERNWSLGTVKTLLARLLSKRAVTHEQDGRRFLYRPALAREEYRGRASVRLVDRLFGGRVTPLVAHLAERDRLSEADIAEIEALLRELKG